MKTITLLLVLAFCLVFVSCNNHTAEVTAFANERSEVVAQMCQTINANPSEAGIDQARKIFDERKPGLQTKWDAIKKANLGLNAMKPILDAQVSDHKMWDDVREKNIERILPIQKKFYSLVNDFNAAL
jgi:hypothetical protein